MKLPNSIPKIRKDHLKSLYDDGKTILVKQYRLRRKRIAQARENCKGINSPPFNPNCTEYKQQKELKGRKKRIIRGTTVFGTQ